jgi:hypothetical protein
VQNKSARSRQIHAPLDLNRDKASACHPTLQPR